MNFIEPSLSDNENNNNNNNQQSLNLEKRKNASTKNIPSNINKQSSTSENNDDNDIKVETYYSVKDKDSKSKFFNKLNDNNEEKNKNFISSTSNLEDSALNKKPEEIKINLENEFKKSGSFGREKNWNSIDNDDVENTNAKGNKKKKKINVDLEKLSKKERRKYKKLKKGMHLLRKAIRSFKKRKKKGLMKIENMDLLRKYFKKWYNIISYYKEKTNTKDDSQQKEEIKEPKNNINEEKNMIRKNQLKKIYDILEKKNKDKLLYYLRKWRRLASIKVNRYQKIYLKGETNYFALSEKEMKNRNEKKNNSYSSRIFQKKIYQEGNIY